MRYVLRFFGLHETGCATVGVDASTRDLHLDTRFVPCGRGWPYAPAYRAGGANPLDGAPPQP